MKTVGKQLQDARTAKGWSPELAARETKIRVDRLHDLEADDYSNFSSPTYARGFVRTYARALNLDEYKILRQLDNKLPEDDNATFANDGGVPYMPEPSQVSKPFEVGRGVYLAGGVAGVVLLLIGFILVQSYRAGYFAATPPATPAIPATNTMPIAPESETARALPADGTAPPVALPVDTSVAATPAPAATTDTNSAPRALPVNPADLANVAAVPAPAASAAPATAPAAGPTMATAAPASAPAAPAPVAPAAASAAPTTAPAIAPVTESAPVPEGTATTPPPAATVPTTTTSPPRALPVDLGAVDATAAPAPTATATSASPTPAPPESHAVHSLSARESNAHSAVNVDAARAATDTLIAETTPATPPPTAAPAAAPAVTGSPEVSTPAPAPDAGASTATAAPAAAPSSLGPASVASPEQAPAADAALTGTAAPTDNGTPAPATESNPAEKFRGQRLVLTASHDSFVRVIALDGPNAGQVRYSSTLHSGQSISFNDRKYSINVGDPSAVDIALDGINYGPHSDNSEPDTFTVESHTP